MATLLQIKTHISSVKKLFCSHNFFLYFWINVQKAHKLTRTFVKFIYMTILLETIEKETSWTKSQRRELKHACIKD